MKSLYIGDFNLRGEIHTFYRYGVSKEQAKAYMINALAEKLGLNPRSLKYYFWGAQDNFSVKKTEPLD